MASLWGSTAQQSRYQQLCVPEADTAHGLIFGVCDTVAAIFGVTHPLL